MFGRVILALNGIGVDGQAQGRADVGLIYLTAYDLYLGKQRGCGFTGPEDAVEIIVAIDVCPVLSIDIQL